MIHFTRIGYNSIIVLNNAETMAGMGMTLNQCSGD